MNENIIKKTIRTPHAVPKTKPSLRAVFKKKANNSKINNSHIKADDISALRSKEICRGWQLPTGIKYKQRHCQSEQIARLTVRAGFFRRTYFQDIAH